jgi:ribosomal protein S18 acetylase RimI-like enzyme
MTPEWDRMRASMWAYFPRMGEGSDRYRVVEFDGVLATVTPVLPDRSVPNSVIYEREEQLEAALPELAKVYEEAGVRAWTVWMPYFHERARTALAEAGHVLDANPEAMIIDLEDAEPPRENDPEPARDPSGADLGAVNDRAYGMKDTFARILGHGELDPAHTYVARLDGEAAATVVTSDHDGDCAIWWVAVAPEARGRGLAAGLMRRALADGKARGCTTSTLQATKLGQPVYERLGYRGLGPIEMWERRRAVEAG